MKKGKAFILCYRDYWDSFSGCLSFATKKPIAFKYQGGSIDFGNRCQFSIN